jgi:hypothetical protein
MSNVYFPIYPTVGVPDHGPNAISATQAYPLGTKLESRDGRVWRYAYAGGVQLSPALMTQSEAIAAEAINEVQTGYTTDIGDTTITILLTTSSGILDGDLVGGWLLITDGTGEGHYYRIASNTWTTGDTVMQLTLHEPILVATEATTEVTVIKNLYNGAIVAPTTLTGICIGVPNLTVTANYYFWAQRRGPCAMVVDTGETLVVGQPVGYPETIAVAGAAGIPTVTDHVWGTVIQIGAAGESAMIDLHLE